MFSQSITKIILLFVLLGWAGYGHSRIDSTNVIRSPYKKERDKFFTFQTFKRGFNSDSLKNELDKLEGRRKDVWSRMDSLHFAQATLRTGNYKLADHYFHYLNPSIKTENEYWWNHIETLLMTDQIRVGLEIMNHDMPGVLQFSEVYFMKKIFIAEIAQKKDVKWYKTHSVLKWEVDTTLNPTDEDFDINIVQPIKNLDKVLKRIIHHIHEEDPVISRTAYEMAMVMEPYFSKSQTYIILSIARHYNKWDKEILAEIKRVKSELLFDKLKIPNFRTYFPRTEYWRFDYEMLKEKVIESKREKNLETPVLRVEAEKQELGFDPQIIVVVGIAFVFLSVLIFLRAKRK
ncbi:MAG: hypothetical protein MK078_09320 [Crocinitomicaceae bacterium]|nr:hypothetical protein [Crocinitomicaceae bacterium]